MGRDGGIGAGRARSSWSRRTESGQRNGVRAEERGYGLRYRVRVPGTGSVAEGQGQGLRDRAKIEGWNQWLMDEVGEGGGETRSGAEG